MKREEAVLRRLIREEAKMTVGDVRKALEYMRGKNQKQALASAAKKAATKGVKAALGLIPGWSTVDTALETGMELKDLYDTAMGAPPEKKKDNPLWDMLTIDPSTSKIVDDSIEHDFISDLSKIVSGLPDSAPLPDVDSQLNSWLAKNYNKTTINKQG